MNKHESSNTVKSPTPEVANPSGPPEGNIKPIPYMKEGFVQRGGAIGFSDYPGPGDNFKSPDDPDPASTLIVPQAGTGGSTQGPLSGNSSSAKLNQVITQGAADAKNDSKIGKSDYMNDKQKGGRRRTRKKRRRSRRGGVLILPSDAAIIAELQKMTCTCRQPADRCTCAVQHLYEQDQQVLESIRTATGVQETLMLSGMGGRTGPRDRALIPNLVARKILIERGRRRRVNPNELGWEGETAPPGKIFIPGQPKKSPDIGGSRKRRKKRRSRRRKRKRRGRSRKQCGGVNVLVHDPAEYPTGDTFRYKIVDKINEIIAECCPTQPVPMIPLPAPTTPVPSLESLRDRFDALNDEGMPVARPVLPGNTVNNSINLTGDKTGGRKRRRKRRNTRRRRQRGGRRRSRRKKRRRKRRTRRKRGMRGGARCPATCSCPPGQDGDDEVPEFNPCGPIATAVPSHGPTARTPARSRRRRRRARANDGLRVGGGGGGGTQHAAAGPWQQQQQQCNHDYKWVSGGGPRGLYRQHRICRKCGHAK